MNISMTNTPRAYKNKRMFAEGNSFASRRDWQNLWDRFEIPGPFMRAIRLKHDKTLELGFRLPVTYSKKGLVIEPFDIWDPDPDNGMTIDFTDMTCRSIDGTFPVRRIWQSFTANVLGTKCFMSEYLFFQIKHKFPNGRIYIRPLTGGHLWLDIPLSVDIRRRIPAIFVKDEPNFNELLDAVKRAQDSANDNPIQVGQPAFPFVGTPAGPGLHPPFRSSPMQMPGYGAPYIGDFPPIVPGAVPGQIIFSDNTLWINSSGTTGNAQFTALLNNLTNE